MLLISGANIPLADLPAPLAALGSWVPPVGAIEAARGVVRGHSLADVAGALGHDLGLGLLYAAAGAAIFGLLERRARRVGALEGF